MKKIFKGTNERVEEALILILCVGLGSFAMGFILFGPFMALIDGGGYLRGSFRVSLIMLALTGGGALGGIYILLLGNVPSNIAIKYGAISYYATVIISVKLSDALSFDFWNVVTVIFIIASLICYIDWLKRKDEYKETFVKDTNANPDEDE